MNLIFACLLTVVAAQQASFVDHVGQAICDSTDGSDRFVLAEVQASYPSVPSDLTAGNAWYESDTYGIGICDVQDLQACAEVCNAVDGCNYFSTSWTDAVDGCYACFIHKTCDSSHDLTGYNSYLLETVTTTQAAVETKQNGETRKNRVTRQIFDDVHLAADQDECLAKNGKWVTITLTDEGGSNGLQMDFVKVHDQTSVKTVSTPIQSSRDRRLSRREDVVTFSDSFCLDYLGEHYSPCYDLVTSSQGANLEELSWAVKVAALKITSEEEKANGLEDHVVEAVKEGAVYDDVKILCGRLFKQLGRYADRQITKLTESLHLENDERYREQKETDNMLRTAAKIAQKAEDLNLATSSS